MNVLITGATGFIGSHLTKALFKQNYHVTCIVRPESREEAVRELRGWANVQIYDGTYESLLHVMGIADPEIVIHVASLFMSQHKSKDIDLLIDSNIKFPTLLLEAISEMKVPIFINTGTSWQHFTNCQYDPVNLYSATKQAFEDILRFYENAHGINAITLKLYDTYGPGDRRKKLFYLLRECARSGNTLSMSPGEQLINLVFIDDIVQAYLAAIRLVKNGITGSYFVSSSDVLSLRQIIDVYGKVIEKSLCIEWGALPYRPREVLIPFSPSPRLPTWTPTVSLEAGIRLMECDPCINGLITA